MEVDTTDPMKLDPDTLTSSSVGVEVMPDVDLPVREVGGEPDFPPRTRLATRHNPEYKTSYYCSKELESEILDEVNRRKRLDYFLSADADDEIDADISDEDYDQDDLIVVDD